ncbi:MAG: RDD family protein [Planctomycetes bacterium]|nr:RDD family protein [Planctomycetota bacterium]
MSAAAAPLEVLSPEHVAIILTPAGLGRRFAAFVVDLSLILGATGLVSAVCHVLPGALLAIIAPTTTFLLFWGYHVWFEVRHRGQSPGKRIARLRVVDARGLPIAFPQSLVRNLVRALDMVPFGGLGLASFLLDPHHRRLGDLAADTLVVEELQRSDADTRGLRSRRDNSLDTPRLRLLAKHRVSLPEREFLLELCLRSERLDPDARYDLFESVGDHFRARLAIEDQRLSGENLVRSLVALCYDRSEG